MPQKKQTDEQRLKELEESLELMDESGLPIPDRKRLTVIDDDPKGMDEFWSEQNKSTE